MSDRTVDSITQVVLDQSPTKHNVNRALFRMAVLRDKLKKGQGVEIPTRNTEAWYIHCGALELLNADRARGRANEHAERAAELYTERLEAGDDVEA